MRKLRAVIRLIGMCLGTIPLYLLWIAGRTICLLIGESPNRVRFLAVRAWARWVARVVGMKVVVDGDPPRPPFLLVSNHLSYVDIVAYATTIDCVFIAKSEIAHWPAIGRLARSIGTIFIDRESLTDLPRVLAVTRGALASGKGIVIFAEGTTTRGDRVQPFGSSLFELPARDNLPVCYASITYRTPKAEAPASNSICWWGDAEFLPHLLDLLEVREFEAVVTFGQEPIRAINRKILAKQLWEAVNSQFTPVN
jgi:1-acyl-sn-glycerol-3-phosphate acyltransferase